MNWHNPMALLLLIPLVTLFFWHFLWRGRTHGSVQFSQIGELKSLPATWRVRLKIIPDILLATAITLFVIALARPRESDQVVKRNVEGIDILIALDVSDSMLIEDMKPMNRLEAAKETISQFVKGRVSDRIGILIFAGESFTLVPLTLDYDMLLSRVKDVTTAQQARIKDGTALGVALANASARLRDSTAKSRVMVFMTDGENNSGTIDPDTGLDIAKGYGIKIYSIGMGKDGRTQIPIYQKDSRGRVIGKTYHPFESYVNDDLLGRMANETGGRYFRASQANSLRETFSEIDRLEKTKIDLNQYTKYRELFPVFVFWGMIIYFVGTLLSLTILRRNP